MVMDQKIKAILSNQLKFSTGQINRLETDGELLAKTLGLLVRYKKSANDNQARQEILQQLLKIRKSLSRLPDGDSKLLAEARSNYYTFKKPKKLLSLQPA